MLSDLKTFSNRFERKYVIDLKTYQSLLRSLAPFLVRDSHAGNKGKYNVISLYYDSNIYHSFTEKIDGEKERAKLRLRTYKDFGREAYLSKNIFLEIKKKNDQTVFKERCVLSVSQAKDFIQNPLFSDELIDRFNQKEITALTETAKMVEMHRLKPKILVHYIREPFVSKYNINLRITFDTCLRYRRNDLRLVPKSTDKYFLPLHLIVMEIKYNTRLPIWIIDTLHKHNCQLGTYSKYCNALISEFEKNKGIIY